MRTIAAESKWLCKTIRNDRRESCENPLPIVSNHLSPLCVRSVRSFRRPEHKRRKFWSLPTVNPTGSCSLDGLLCAITRHAQKTTEYHSENNKKKYKTKNVCAFQKVCRFSLIRFKKDLKRLLHILFVWRCLHVYVLRIRHFFLFVFFIFFFGTASKISFSLDRI